MRSTLPICSSHHLCGWCLTWGSHSLWRLHCLHGAHIIYEGHPVWAFCRSRMSTVYMGFILFMWESHCIWRFISVADTVLSVWVFIVGWYQLCVYSVHTGKEVLPACSMPDQDLGTSDKAAKETDPTPALWSWHSVGQANPLRIFPVYVIHIRVQMFQGVVLASNGHESVLCVWGYIYWYYVGYREFTVQRWVYSLIDSQALCQAWRILQATKPLPSQSWQ